MYQSLLPLGSFYDDYFIYIFAYTCYPYEYTKMEIIRCVKHHF